MKRWRIGSRDSFPCQVKTASLYDLSSCFSFRSLQDRSFVRASSLCTVLRATSTISEPFLSDLCEVQSAVERRVTVSSDSYGLEARSGAR